MKAKVLMIFAIVVIAIYLSFCGTVGPTDPDITPKSKSVTVDYARVLPVLNPEAMDITTLNWRFGNMEGGMADMSKTAENTFSAGAFIKTETRIRIWVNDPRMWNGSSLVVRRILKVDGQELVITGTHGELTFIYHNDGRIEVIE